MIFHSVRLGAYSTSSCSVDGMKPGTIRPMPFSIQTPTNAKPHAASNQRRSVRDFGDSRITADATLKATEVQIHGTRACAPCRPKKR